MAKTIREEVRIVNKKLERLLDEFSTKERKKILRRAARPMRKAARLGIKDADKPVKRYSTPKVLKGLRAPKGKGKVVAIYHPGNLRRSIKILSFRRAKTAVFVGPKLGKQGASQFGKPGQKVDGYYAHIYEFGSVNYRGRAPMRKAFAKTKNNVRALIEEGVDKKIREYKKKTGL